jgi:glutamine cyclotransferase
LLAKYEYELKLPNEDTDVFNGIAYDKNDDG